MRPNSSPPGLSGWYRRLVRYSESGDDAHLLLQQLHGRFSVELVGRRVREDRLSTDRLLDRTAQKLNRGNGVRILETELTSSNTAQFLVSTRPDLSPSAIVQSIKGRWQYILQSQFPSAFRRNYFIGSVGEANSETLSNYVSRQTDRHPMVDVRVMAHLESLQFHDPVVCARDDSPFRFSYYAGTFGEYDRNAIRRLIGDR